LAGKIEGVTEDEARGKEEEILAGKIEGVTEDEARDKEE
jgi:hypothetical protein